MLSQKVELTRYLGKHNEEFDTQEEAEDSIMSDWLYKKSGEHGSDFRKVLEEANKDEDKRQWILGILGGEG